MGNSNNIDITEKLIADIMHDLAREGVTTIWRFKDCLAYNHAVNDDLRSRLAAVYNLFNIAVSRRAVEYIENALQKDCSEVPDGTPMPIGCGISSIELMEYTFHEAHGINTEALLQEMTDAGVKSIMTREGRGPTEPATDSMSIGISDPVKMKITRDMAKGILECKSGFCPTDDTSDGELLEILKFKMTHHQRAILKYCKDNKHYDITLGCYVIPCGIIYIDADNREEWEITHPELFEEQTP